MFFCTPSDFHFSIRMKRIKKKLLVRIFCIDNSVARFVSIVFFYVLFILLSLNVVLIEIFGLIPVIRLELFG